MAFALCCRPAAAPPVVPPDTATPPFSGIVRDSITPASDVSIALYKGTVLLTTTATDAGGRFTFGLRPRGDYQFKISSNQYASCTLDVSFSPGQRDVVIGVVPASDSARLQRQRAASGNSCSCRIPIPNPTSTSSSSPREALPLPNPSRATLAVDVEDAHDGGGVARADVVLTPDAQPGGMRLGASTDLTGRAVFRDLAVGKYSVLVRRIGFVPSRTEVVTIAGAVDSLTVPMKWDVSQLCITVRTGR